MKVILNDKVYEVLKWTVLIILPATVVLLEALQEAWHWDIPMAAITATIAAVATFIGSIIGVSTVNYYKSVKENQNGED